MQQLHATLVVICFHLHLQHVVVNPVLSRSLYMCSSMYRSDEEKTQNCATAEKKISTKAIGNRKKRLLVRLRSEDKHHLRKSADRKAQIRKAFVPLTRLSCLKETFPVA